MCTASHVNARDDWKCTALDYLLQQARMTAANLMVRNGAHIDHVLMLQTRRYQLEREAERFTDGVRSGGEADRTDADSASTCEELLRRHVGLVAEARATGRERKHEKEPETAPKPGAEPRVGVGMRADLHEACGLDWRSSTLHP